MNCKKCGYELPDDGKYCPNCGARADGKKNCQFCDREINEESVYCTYCGSRVDGKKICSKCGTIIEGDFCHVCGENNSVAKKVSCQTKNNTRGKDIFAKVESWTTPSLLLASLLVLFICSFFVGAYIKVGNLEEANVGFYFFGKSFEEIDLIVKATVGDIPTKNLEAFESLLKTPYTVCAVFVGVNIAVSLAMLVVSTIKFVFGAKNGSKIKITNYVGIAYATFFATAVFILAMATVSLNTYGVDTVKFGMTAGSTCGIVISSIFIVLAIVLKQIKKGKASISAENLKKMIPAICLLVLCVIFISNSAYFINIENTINNVEVTSTMSVLMYMGVTATNIYSLGQSYKTSVMDRHVTIANISLFGYIFLIISVGLLMLVVVNALLCKKNKCATSIFVLSIISAVASIVQFVLSIIINDSYQNFLNATNSTAVCSINTVGLLIIGVITLGAGITYFVLNKKKNLTE